jgi:hypothetical protein
MAWGVAKGSVLGAPLATCKGVTIKFDVGYGFGFEISHEASQFLQKVLGGGWKYEVEREALVNVVNRKSVIPDVPLCRG